MRGCRIDKHLVDIGLVESREKAQRLVMAGKVRAGDHVYRKSSEIVKSPTIVTLDQDEKFVSRGGYKIEKALDYFEISVSGLVAIDAGASTGGFTDCLLQKGVKKIYSVDVGKGQLAWKLRNDPRVIVKEKLNARNMTARQLDPKFEPVDLIVVDCSFISLKVLIPNLVLFLKPGGIMIPLIKPQFEAGKALVDKGKGVIRDPQIHDDVILSLKKFTKSELGLEWKQVTESPILGPSGNKEFLVYISKKD